uniref:neutrophil cytosol factor 4 n=1 Tax=Myxine glutinosa TaxID=7769 RepID=UPI0035902410
MNHQLRENTDFEQLPDDVPIYGNVCDMECCCGFSSFYMFTIEMTMKGGDHYFIYRRYSEFYELNKTLKEKYFSDDEKDEKEINFLSTFPGKIYIGRKEKVAETRIPQITKYIQELLSMPVWMLMDENVRLFFYQTQADQERIPKRLRRRRPPTRKLKLPHTLRRQVTEIVGPRAKAMFDFLASDEKELSISEGDVISLLQRINDDWFEGSLKNRTGIFPASYVEVVQDLLATDDDGDGEMSGVEQEGSKRLLRCFFHEEGQSYIRDIFIKEDLANRPSYSAILQVVRKEMGEDDLILNYVDHEGDMVRLMDDADLSILLMESTGLSVSRDILEKSELADVGAQKHPINCRYDAILRRHRIGVCWAKAKQAVR